jgi:GDP-D-mannose 3', 5'-epimerase
MIVKISGKDINIFYDTTKPEGDKARAADYSKAMELLGWRPKVDLGEGLREQYEWIKSAIEKTN